MSEYQGCDKCKFSHRDGDEHPCRRCIHNAVSYYEPMTNADRIRNMTDEELAEFLSKTVDDIVSCDVCDEPTNKYGSCSGNCKNLYLKWLQTEVKGGE